MRILVVGSGGREHALAWALKASPLCEALFCAPGNAGIAREASLVPIGAEDIDALVGFARDQRIDLVVVGPEKPLVLGLVDRLEEAGIKAFGPNARAAMLEGSKGFMKDLAIASGVPTAAYGRFSELASAETFIRERGAPIVVKVDGLAAGKGVTVATTVEEAIAAARAALQEHRFGDAGAQVVVEEYLEGEELSYFALVDGTNVLPLATAQDHKRVGDGDTGPNTGGMGAYSPPPIATPVLNDMILTRIVRPTVAAMAAAGRPYRGVLFAGIVLTAAGPKLLEYNVRFGDPETQAMLVRLKSDLLPALLATVDGMLSRFDLRWHDEVGLTVVMAAKGYPGTPLQGSEIRGLESAEAMPGVTVFHAGTALNDGRLIAAGGRVLNVTALGADVAEARARAYAAIDRIDWPQGFCRRDIGWRAIPQASS